MHRRASRHRQLILGALLGLVLISPLSGQSSRSRQPQDETFAELVRQWTTAPEFLSPLVDHLPVADGIPSPREVLGHHIGIPRELTYYDEIVTYYHALAAASPRVTTLPIGLTDEGREMMVVALGAEDTIRDLDRFRGYLERLADPRGLSEAEADAIIGQAKPIYHLMAGLHSGETGPPEMLMELAYRLAAEEGPFFDDIRENVIVTLTPTAEPDGRDRYVDWYYRHLIDITDDRDRMVGPPYWGRYIFHDNNRDINYSQLTMRALLEWYLDWHPPIVHDLHESVPFLYSFSGQAPQNPALDPIVYGELPWFANFEMAQLTRYGMPGVWTHGFVDMWSPGYLAFMSSNHNGLVRFYETYGNGGATTMTRHLKTEDNTPEEARTSREWFRPSPPYEEVEWSMRNNVNYSQTAVLTALQLTASHPSVILENFYQKSRNAVQDGREHPPYGYVLPAGQRDMTRVATLVDMLVLQGIEVGQFDVPVELGSHTYPTGSFVVKRDQPYGRLAKILLDTQDFPEGNLRTYDDTGWTMGLMHQTRVAAIDDPALLMIPTEPVTTGGTRGRTVEGPAPHGYAIAHHGSNHMVTLRYRLSSYPVEAVEEPFAVDDLEFPAGSFIIPPANGSLPEHLQAAVEALGLTAVPLSQPVDTRRHLVDLPRLAVYSTWGDTQEVGWVRHALDQFDVPFDLIFKEEVRAGRLRSAFDVIVVPDQGGSAKGLVFDIEADAPLAYTKTDRFRYLGDYGSSEDITGGMGLEGVLELQRFVEDGGLLVTLGTSSYFPPQFGLTREIDARRPDPEFYAPGPIVRAEILKADHPIFYGYADTEVPVRYANGPLLRVPRRSREDQVLMQLPGGADGVMAGHMRGADQIEDTPALVEVERGSGRVLLFATNPCYRWQNHGEFNMLFNSILHHNDL